MLLYTAVLGAAPGAGTAQLCWLPAAVASEADGAAAAGTAAGSSKGSAAAGGQEALTGRALTWQVPDNITYLQAQMQELLDRM